MNEIVTSQAPSTDDLQAGHVFSLALLTGPGAIVQRLIAGVVVESVPITASASFGPYLHNMQFRVSCIGGGRVATSAAPQTGAQLTAAQIAANQALVSGAGTSEIYVQPDATGTWAARPSGLVVPIPTWARFLTLSICTSGGAGGSGRRGATLTARSGGAGGQPGVIAVFKIPLRDAVGALVAASGTLTVGASPAGGAAAATDDTSGNGSPAMSNTTFVLNADSYLVAAGGNPAPGGTTVSVNHSGAPTYMFPPQTAAATSISANVALTYPSGPVSFGAPGGSISAADVLLTTGGVAVAQTGGSALQTLVAGANGSGFLRGNIFSAVGGAGGASSSSAAAQAGGNGIYGSGGGGGGASLNGFNSGAGGRGGAGWAVLVWE